MATSDKRPAPFGQSGNVLTTTLPGIDNLAQSVGIGDTVVVGANLVNALRFSYNRTAVDRHNVDFFEAYDLGIDAYNYSPTKEIVIEVADAGGFDISAATATKGVALNPSFQVGDDVTLLRGSHQIAVGVNVAHYRSEQANFGRSSGTFTFDGAATGTGLSDLLLGRLQQIEHGSRNALTFTQWYQAAYVQDTWRATNRLTINAGLRWEPFSGQNLEEGAIANFSFENFTNGVKSNAYVNAPAGFLYPGDPGFPSGRTGFDKRWGNMAPRVGLAWDASGDGRTSVRSSYAINYDIPSGETWSRLAGGAPFGNRIRVTNPPGGFDNPYAHLGGDPHPIETNRDTPFPPFGAFGVINPEINAPRVQSWNLTVEQQLGTDWGVSASYLGSYSDRLWARIQINPGVYIPGSCTLNTVDGPVFYRTCTASGNLDFRRVLYLENPHEAQYISSLDLLTEAGTQNYRGLKLSFRRRSAGGVSLNGNYTLSRCYGLDWAETAGSAGGSTNPADPSHDRGHCSNDRTHLANLTASVETPEFESPALRAVASGWRVGGIINARSGQWLSVTTGSAAFNGVGGGGGHRVNQVSDVVYGG
jgi:hypothetical protein